MLYWLRKSRTALFLVGGPLVGIVAANGINDLLALTLLTMGLVALREREGRWVQLVAMGFKQVASVVDFAYWAGRRNVWMTAVFGPRVQRSLKSGNYQDWREQADRRLRRRAPGLPGFPEVVLRVAGVLRVLHPFSASPAVVEEGDLRPEP